MGKKILAGPGAEGLPVSEAVLAGDFIFVSGMVAMDAAGKVIPGGISVETTAILTDVGRILARARASLTDVVKVNVYLADPADFEAFNATYRLFFKEAPPARISLSARLTIEARVELDLVAYIGDIRESRRWSWVPH